MDAAAPPPRGQEGQGDRSGGDEGGRYGVLLYYKYAEVPDAAALAAFYESHCRALALVGRVRVGPDGVNATLGGRMAALEKHVAEMSSNALFDGTDFKLASCDDPVDERVARECGFTSLSVRLVKVFLLLPFRNSMQPRSCPNYIYILSCFLQLAGAGNALRKPVVGNPADYMRREAFVGCEVPFGTPKCWSVDSETDVCPILRFSGLKLSTECLRWGFVIAGATSDSEATVEKSEVVVLDARNIYETRIGKFRVPNVETLDPEIRQYSDLPLWIDEHAEKLRGKSIMMYCTGGIRCEMASAYIRSKGEGFENVFQLYGGIQRYLERFPDGGYFEGKNFVFDHRISVGSLKENILGTCLLCGSSFDDYSPRCRCSHCRMLVLVCSTCQDSTKDYVCELCQKNGKQCCQTSPRQGCKTESELIDSSDFGIPMIINQSATSTIPRSNGSEQLKKLKILCLHGFRQNASNFKGRTSALAKKLKHIADLVFIDAPHELSFVYKPNPDHCSGRSSLPSGTPKRKYAWLVAPNSIFYAEHDWKIADAPFDPLQYQQQTDGFEESYAYLEHAISQMGNIDGILGFSQGAAMAALFCRQQQKTCGSLKFRFGIFCSGYPAPIISDFDGEPIKLPSLHCFGNSEDHDRQIANRASTELANRFDKSCRSVIEHDMGHIIPTRPPFIDKIKEFLSNFI
uniref:Rhodanese domain-containing protein n=1 Tax=Oryza barthii TaxID=65489 RepID=A0A0D3HVR3_9ORYZ